VGHNAAAAANNTGEIGTDAEPINTRVHGFVKTTDCFIVPKASDKGIKVDTATPTFPWRDMLAFIHVKSTSAASPAFNAFRSGILAYQFSNVITNEVFLEFHIPHDYVMGTDLYIHTHWSQDKVDTGGPAGAPGDVKWQYEFTYSKGHNQDFFPVSKTLAVVQTAATVAFQHMIAEVQLSVSGGSATQIDTARVEPDGIILVRMFRDPADAADTLSDPPYAHFCDVHYQSTNVGTKAKAPSFYT